MSFTFMYAVCVYMDGGKGGGAKTSHTTTTVRKTVGALHPSACADEGWWGRLWRERRGPCCAGNAGRGQELLPLLAGP